MFEIVTVQFP